MDDLISRQAAIDALKELRWDDALIKHFMVDDSEYLEIVDTTSLTINYNPPLIGAEMIGEANELV